MIASEPDAHSNPKEGITMLFTDERFERMLSQCGIVLGKDITLGPGIKPIDVFGDRIRVGDGFVTRKWDAPSLKNLFSKLARSKLYLVGFLGPNAPRNDSAVQTAEKIAEHYNLGADFHYAMLGDSRAYTCADWRHVGNLDDAQEMKFERIAQKLQLKKGDAVLDVGGGFGSLARYIAKRYEVEVHVTTISKSQKTAGEEHCKGIPVTFHLLDYRDMDIDSFGGKEFRKIVSVGMFEHVGHKSYNLFMQKMAEMLSDDGIFLLHTIFGRDQSICPWINERIFPGGELPTPAEIEESSMRFGLTSRDVEEIGRYYTPTLWAWWNNLQENMSALSSKYPEEVFRMYNFYLHYCAILFQIDVIGVRQTVFTKMGAPEYVRTI